MVAKRTSGVTVTLTVTPTKGDPVTRPIEVKSLTVGDVLETAQVSGANKNLTVNGAPAELTTAIANGDKVGVAERPAGS